MQKYDEKCLIPNNLPLSSPTCCDYKMKLRQIAFMILFLVAKSTEISMLNLNTYAYEKEKS